MMEEEVPRFRHEIRVEMLENEDLAIAKDYYVQREWMREHNLNYSSLEKEK